MMQSDKRGPGSPSSRRRVSFRPSNERLEDRKLMAVVDLANIAQSQASNSNLALGVQEIGATTGDGAGFTVANVGDVTGSGYDSFLVSSPTVTASTGLGTPIGTGQGKVYLIFGSKTVNSGTITNFLNLTPNERVGDLLSLGTTGQVNPLIVTPTDGSPVGFNFDGITFTTSGTASQLGASVAGVGDLDGDGLNDFAIGAPNQGTGGTAYVVFGSTNLASSSGANVNLDAGTAPTRVASFTSPNAGDQVGSSVAGIGKFLTKGTTVNDLAIGAPGSNGNAGTVYTLSGASVASAGLGVNLTTFATTNGVIFTGQANDRAGAALSTAGNFGDYDGTTTANIEAINGLLIGAPGPVTTGTFTSGRSYLIYGNQTIEGTAAATIAPGGGTYDLTTVGVATPTTAIPFPVKGLILNGISANRLGFAVNSAGDFNSDGFDDVIIGAPGGAGSGFAAVIYGRSSSTRLNGTFQIDPFAGGPLSTQYFTAATAGDLTGYSLAPIALYNGEQAGFLKGLAIGAPGTAGGLGAVYVIPSVFAAPGASTNISVVQAQTLTATNSAGTPAGVGTSVSTRPLFAANRFYTVDQDPLDDLIVGAPGYTPNVIGNAAGTATTRPLAGSAFAVSGLKLLDRINPAIGINSLTPNYAFNPSTTTTITIFVASAPATPTQPAFAPFTQLDPASIVINGVIFPGVTLASVPDVNGDGVPEASFTISTSGLDTTGTTLPILFSADTTNGLPISGSTIASLTGNTPPTPTPIPGGGGIGFFNTFSARLAPATFSGFYGGELVPGVETLEHLNSYKPLPVTVAYEQFLPEPGFRARQQIFAKGNKTKARLHQAPAGTTVNDKYLGVNTVSNKIRTRGQFKKGQSIQFTHKVKVIPRNRQKDIYTSF